MDFGEIFGFILPLLERVPTIRAILGFILLLVLPGFAWTLVFFRQVNILERIGLSFGLSIAIVTLSIITLNVLLGVRITAVNVILTVIVIVIIPLAIYYLKKFISSGSSEQS